MRYAVDTGVCLYNEKSSEYTFVGLSLVLALFHRRAAWSPICELFCRERSRRKRIELMSLARMYCKKINQAHIYPTTQRVNRPRCHPVPLSSGLPIAFLDFDIGTNMYTGGFDAYPQIYKLRVLKGPGAIPGSGGICHPALKLLHPRVRRRTIGWE